MIYSSISELSDLIIRKISSIVDKSDTSEDMLLLSKSTKEVFSVSQDTIDAVEAATIAKESAVSAKSSETKVTEIYNKFGNVDTAIVEVTKIRDEIIELTQEFSDVASILDSIRLSEQNVIRMHNEIASSQILWATCLITTQKLFIEQHGFK